VLRRAGIETADMVIAVTSIDTTNIVVCVLAERYGVKYKVARVRNREYRDLAELRNLRLPDAERESQAKAIAAGPSALTGLVDMIINPEDIIIDNLRQFIFSPGAIEVADFASGEIQLRKFPVREGTPIAGKKIKELAVYTQAEPFLLVAIDRGDETIVPSGDDEVRPGDLVTIIMPDGVLPFVLQLVGHTIDETKKVVIAGSSGISIQLAQALEEDIGDIRFIGENRELCDRATEVLRRTTVLNGKTTDDDIQAEAGMEAADYFIAMTDSDEHNLLSCLLARRNGAKRVAMLVHEVNYLRVLEQIGIDIAINSRLLTMGAILRYVRRGKILSIAKFHGDRAEAIEMEVEEHARICGKPLSEIRIPRGAILGAVQRGEEILLPSGQTRIQPGDKVIVFTLTSAVPKVEHLFARRGLLG